MDWIDGRNPQDAFDAEVKIRYKATKASSRISQLANGRTHVRFEDPQRGVTPGQAAVIYSGEEVLGSGLISDTRPIQLEEIRSLDQALV